MGSVTGVSKIDLIGDEIVRLARDIELLEGAVGAGVDVREELELKRLLLKEKESAFNCAHGG